MATKIIMLSLVVVLSVVLIVLVGSRYLLVNYTDPWHEKVRAAGFESKTANINQLQLHYLEGPRNGPPLILLHAQHMDWFSYSRVMPALSKSFHVFSIDYPGHGETTYPADYKMNANQIGGDLADFIETRIQEPVFVTGNSSGGLLTTWLAARKPTLVRAILLEDPPLFSAEYPRIKETIAYRSFTTANQYAQDQQTGSFLLYWIHHNSAFFDNNIFKGAGSILTSTIETYRDANPNAAVELRFLRNDIIKLMLRGLDKYDARFGAAFYNGSWNEDFDHASALAAINCPALLIHANYRFLPDGTLYGAMSADEAARAASLLRQGDFRTLDAEHVVHLDQPQQFITLIEQFFLENREL